MNINSEHTEGIANELKKPSIEETDKIKEKQEMVAKIKKFAKDTIIFINIVKVKWKNLKVNLNNLMKILKT